MLSIQVQDTPLHLVMWKSKDTTTTTEITELKKRIEELEGVVHKLLTTSSNSGLRNRPVNNETILLTQTIIADNKEKVTKSPFFKSTSVPEPVGLEVLSNLNLDDKASQSTLNETEVFDKLTQGLNETNANHEEKTVDLNGMTFVIRKWGDDLVYCEGNTGRAFLDPKDAFNNPNKHYIGYWNTDAETVSVRSEDIDDESIVGQLAEAEQRKVSSVQPTKEEEEVEEEVEEEEEVVEEEEVEEEVEEGEELEEIEYKGVTYYRDSENQVYLPNEEGEVDTEHPVGVWNEEKQKVLKYK